MAWLLPAPAKVNLYLRVVGKRPDGYHELETVFHAIDFADRLVGDVAADDRVTLEIEGGAGTGLQVASGADNLVVRAAEAFRRVANVEHGLRFRLHKRVPAGGGLGGGSSDAAAALRIANVACGAPLDDDALGRIAASLGADVPFFLRGETQLGQGTGTELQAMAPLNLWFVLLIPPFGTSTVRVYENYRPHLHDDAPLHSIRSTGLADVRQFRLATMRNDLETAASSAYPELGRLHAAVVAAGCPQARVSGSGSTMFLAFGSEPEADRAAEAIKSFAETEGVRLERARSARHVAPTSVSWPGGAAG